MEHGGGVKGVQDIARACVAVQPRITEGGADRREAFPEPEALREARQVLGSAPVGGTDPVRHRRSRVQDVTLAHDLALLPRYAWQTSLQSVKAHHPSGKRGSRCGFLLSSKGGLRLVSVHTADCRLVPPHSRYVIGVVAYSDQRRACGTPRRHHVRAGTSFPRVRACIGMARLPKANFPRTGRSGPLE